MAHSGISKCRGCGEHRLLEYGYCCDCQGVQYVEELRRQNGEMRNMIYSALGDAHYFGAESSAKDTLDGFREWWAKNPPPQRGIRP
jgi:hypothetical protein